MQQNIFSFHHSEQGHNHKKYSPPKVCEDFSGHEDDYEKGYHICVVADGHGSDDCPRSNFGSQFAVEASIECIKEFIENVVPEEFLNDIQNGFLQCRQLSKSILANWYRKVEAHFENNPFTDEELSLVSEKYRTRFMSEDPAVRKTEKAYGTTLIVFVITDFYSFGFQVGDGKCIVVNNNGEMFEPIPWDEHCQLNVTTSICDTNAPNEFRYYVSQNSPVAVFCGSDGIDDSYTGMDEVCALYRSILEIYIEDGKEIGDQEIREYLPTLSQKGSGDDVSVALIIDLDKAKQIHPLLKRQSEQFKLIDKKKKAEENLHTLTVRKATLVKQGGSYFKHEQESINSGKLVIQDNVVADDIIIRIRKINEDISELMKEIEALDIQISGLVEKENTDSEPIIQDRITDSGLEGDDTEMGQIFEKAPFNGEDAGNTNGMTD